MSPDVVGGAPDGDGGVTCCRSFVGAGDDEDDERVDVSRAAAALRLSSYRWDGERVVRVPLLILSLDERPVAGVPQAEEQVGSAQCVDEANVMVATKASVGVDKDEDDLLLLFVGR